MKAVFVNSDHKELVIKEADKPKPGKGEVLVKMLASPINPSDLAKINEIDFEGSKSYIPGTEGCGVVVEAGKGILPKLLKGRRVACHATYSYSGCWSEYLLTKAGSCFPVIKKISDDLASMLIVNPMTAIALADIVFEQKQQTVIVSSAASTVSQMLNTIFRKKQIEVINIVNSAEKVNSLKENGLLNVLNSNSASFPDDFKYLSGKYKPSIMIDAVGGELINKLLPFLPENAKIISYGNLSNEEIRFLPPVIVRQSKSIEGFFLGNYTKQKGMLKTFIMLIRANKLLKSHFKINIQACFRLDEVNIAVQEYLNNMTKGKVIIKP